MHYIIYKVRCVKVKSDEKFDCSIFKEYNYYKLNNQYVGYVDLILHSRLRSKTWWVLEEEDGLIRHYKPIYHLFCENNSQQDNTLHIKNCNADMMTAGEVRKLVKSTNDPKFKKIVGAPWYEVYYPDKNSSETVLKEILKPYGSGKIIDDSTFSILHFLSKL